MNASDFGEKAQEIKDFDVWLDLLKLKRSDIYEAIEEVVYPKNLVLENDLDDIER